MASGKGGGARLATPRDLRLFREHCQKLAKVFQRAAANPLPNAAEAAALCADRERMLREAGELAGATLRTRGSLMPSYTFLSRHGVQGVIALENMPEEAGQRAAMTASLATLVRFGPVDAYVFAMEAWMADYQVGPDGRTLHDVDPIDRPDRREVVLVTATNPGGLSERAFAIERGPDGAPLRLRPLTHQEVAGIPGDAEVASRAVKPLNPMLENLYEVGERVDRVASGEAAHLHPGVPGRTH